MWSRLKLALYLVCTFLAVLNVSEGVSLQRTDKKNVLFATSKNEMQQQLQVSKSEIILGRIQNLATKQPEHECLLEKAKVRLSL